METRSLKALSVLRLKGNQGGNRPETQGFPQTKTRGTCLTPAETFQVPATMFTWRNHYSQGTPQARKESLIQCMAATWKTMQEDAKKRKPQGYELTKSVLKAEDEIAIAYQRVLSGVALLSDFRQAAQRWMLAVLDDKMR